MKCLEKNRARRYETVQELAADIRRSSRDEPILARPPGYLYRVQKLVRRNKVVVIAGAAVLFGLVMGLVLATWLGSRAEQLPARFQSDPTVDLTKEQ